MYFFNACLSMLTDICSFHAVYLALVSAVALVVLKLACYFLTPRHKL